MTRKNTTTNTSGGVVQLLKMSPMAQALMAGPVKLPVAKAPSLERLTVSVPKPDDLTTDDLVERLNEKARALAKTRERAKGEALAMGDDVQVDTLGYVDGKLIPFSARFGLWLELAPVIALPGFHEGIAQARVGDAVQLQLTLPTDFPVESLRGKPARFVVDVKAAREVAKPELESPAFLAQLKLGEDLDTVMDAIRGELEDELTDELWVLARDLVLDEVAARSGVEVPRSLVDEEIRRRWGDVEGKHLVEHNFDVTEQQEAMQAWLDDAPTRADCERRLKIGLALKAMAEAEKLTLTPEKLEALLTTHVEGFGLGAEDVRKGLRESEETTKKLTELGWYLFAVDHAMSKAKVTFEGAGA